jgi:hypothetical protein
MKLVNFSYTVIRTKRKNETRSQTVIHQFLNEEMDSETPGCCLFVLKIQYLHFSLQISVIFPKEGVLCGVGRGTTCLVYSYERPISVPQSDKASCQLFQTFFGMCYTRPGRKGSFVVFLSLFGETQGSYLDTRESQIMTVLTSL